MANLRGAPCLSHPVGELVLTLRGLSLLFLAPLLFAFPLPIAFLLLPHLFLKTIPHGEFLSSDPSSGVQDVADATYLASRREVSDPFWV